MWQLDVHSDVSRSVSEAEWDGNDGGLQARKRRGKAHGLVWEK